jgi:uncharacterized small protein (DUF1192 family)
MSELRMRSYVAAEIRKQRDEVDRDNDRIWQALVEGLMIAQSLTDRIDALQADVDRLKAASG